MATRSTLCVLSVCLFTFAACGSDDSVDFTPDCSGTYTFSDDVSPIIESRCAANSGCHASGSTRGPGELLTYSQVYNARHSISTAVASGDMPKGSTMTTTEKNAILCWIDNGAAED